MNCGVLVTGTYLITLNSDYVYDGTLRKDELFRITDISDKVTEQLLHVEDNIVLARDILSNETEPDIHLSERCRSPYYCGFWNYSPAAFQNPLCLTYTGLLSEKNSNTLNVG